MKVNPYILFVLILAAILLSLKMNDALPLPIQVDDKQLTPTTELNSVDKIESSSGLTPEYFMKFFSENGFTVLPVFAGKTSDIYTGKVIVDDTNIEFRIDVYYERSSKEILLIEGIIDGSYYVNSPNENEVVELLDKAANSYFGSLASLPYTTSKPNDAESWIKNSIIKSYSREPKEKMSQQFGLATINIYGTPLLRTLEIDFGF